MTENLLSIYVASLSLGGVLILVSIFFGGDADADLDIDADADFDGEVHVADGALAEIDGAGAAWLPFLSLRFWTFFLGAFGLSGTLMSLLGLPSLITLVASVGLGATIGWGVAMGFRVLMAQKVTGNVGLLDLEGKEAKVLLPVGPERKGKIRALIDGQYVDLIATTQDGTELVRGDRALVVHIRDGMAEISSLKTTP
jgi:hypothetical protein